MPKLAAVARELAGPSSNRWTVAGWFNPRRFLDELYRVCSPSQARFTYENSAIELSILLCISEARENFANRRREAHNRRASGSGGAFTYLPCKCN